MTPEEYAAIPAMNWSSLKHMGVSPLNFQWHRENPQPSKPAFVFGGAVHCALLEPERFDQRYAIFNNEEEVVEEGETRKKKKQRRGKGWEQWKAEHPGCEALTPKEMDRVRRCADRALKDRHAAPLLRGGRHEEPLVWTDEQTGIRCKGRLDHLRPDLLIDVKTTRDPSYSAFQRAIMSYGYNAQCAWYQAGAVANHKIDGKRAPVIIAVRTDGDCDVAVYPLDPGMLAHGAARCRRLLQQLEMCTNTNYWPGVAPEPQLMVLPAWAENELGFTQNESEDF